eukprot:TRINITY_DN2035_c0_g1_i1.p1 TRINITY_DN2035_c0_g1~~TRINITY_DN2035_c0_g1_i1.p1  ORF type:complete len:206 (-),score=47.04 TRINITY_DN2035_c0_g1_i1:66-683(-)
MEGLEVKEINKEIDLKYVKGFLSPEDCTTLVGMVGESFTRSKVVEKNEKDSGHISLESHETRTSSSFFFLQSQNDLIKQVEKKALRLIGCKLRDLEPLQLVKYEGSNKEKFDAHYDYFDVETFKEEIKGRGQRYYTILVYLLEPEEGGETTFVNLGLSFKPVQGDALMWNNLLPDNKGNPKTLHQGAPVIKGRKIAMNIWSRKHI